LSDNAIPAVPAAIAALAESLTVLRLPNNRLTAGGLPAELWVCSALKVLDLAGNAIEALPPAVAGLRGLVELNLARNRISALPDAVCELAGLALLRVSDNPTLATLPDRLGWCGRLVELAADNCALAVLSPSLPRCPLLRTLRCSNNRLTDDGVRGALAGCAALAWIDLRHNRLTAFPALPPSPSEVYVGVNAITHVPPAHLARSSLTVLDVSDNRLAALPEDALRSLTALTTLDLRNNDLATLPPVLGYLPLLKRLAFEGNPLRSMKRGLLGAPAEEVKAYLRTRAAPDATSALEAVAEAGARPAVGLADGEGGLHTRAWAAATRDATVDGRLVLSPALFAVPPAPPLARVTLSLLHGGPLALLPRLRHLVLDGLPMGAPDAIPRDLLTAAPCLELLSMAGCGLTDLPLTVLAPAGGVSAWPAPPALRTLRLPRNRIVVEDVRRLPPALRTLDLSFNPIAHVPWGLPTLSALEELLLEGCGIATASDPAYDAAALAVPSLRLLVLAANRLTSIPSVLATLPHLAALDVRDNEIAHLDADALGRAPRSLVALHLEGNPQRTVRQPIVARGGGAVMEYLRLRAGASVGDTVTDTAPPGARKDGAPASAAARHVATPVDAGGGHASGFSAAVSRFPEPLPHPTRTLAPAAASHHAPSRARWPAVEPSSYAAAPSPPASLMEQIAALEGELAATGGGAGRVTAETALLKRKLTLLRAQAAREGRG
jgi:Leucine-rich repeat (LRR) protein